MKQKLSISNIAWLPERDEQMFVFLKEHGIGGLEIAPTRIFPDAPYDKLEQAKSWAEGIQKEYGLVVPSMQSIWFGRNEMLFGTDQERRELFCHTKKVIDFASAIGCGNLVFGCPRNRNLPDGADASVAIPFFRQLGNYAAEHGTAIGMEANPPIYHTNYVNDTVSALRLIEEVDSPGFLLNLDVGTMVQNGETADLLIGNVYLINHVHVSEPRLVPIKRRELHGKLMGILKRENYHGFVSIEMGLQEDLGVIEDVIEYITEITYE